MPLYQARQQSILTTEPHDYFSATAHRDHRTLLSFLPCQGFPHQQPQRHHPQHPGPGDCGDSDLFVRVAATSDLGKSKFDSGVDTAVWCVVQYRGHVMVARRDDSSNDAPLPSCHPPFLPCQGSPQQQPQRHHSQQPGECGDSEAFVRVVIT